MAIGTNPRGTSTNHVLSTTLDHYYRSGKMHDAIFYANPLLATLRQNGRMVKRVAGGYQIDVGLMYGKNSTVGSYSGYEVLDVASQDGMGQAFYPWCQYAVSVSIDGMTEFQNSGSGRLIDLLAQKTKQATMSLAETLSEDLWAVEGLTTATTGNGGKNIISIPLYVQKDPTGTIDIGGIDESALSWWQNQIIDGGSTDTYVALTSNLRHIFNLCSKKQGGPPDMIFMDMGVFEAYEASLDRYKRYSDEMATDTVSQDFGALKYKTAKVFWDVHVPDMNAGVDYDSASFADGSIFALNSKFLELVIGAGKDFKWTNFKQPEDQDARVANCLFYGQLVCSNRNKQGLVFEVEDSAAAYS